MHKKIEWKRDVSGKEPEVLEGNKPLGAIPQEGGNLLPGYLQWTYKRGDQTRVKVLNTDNSQEYDFMDIDSGQLISKIPHDAFRFLK